MNESKSGISKLNYWFFKYQLKNMMRGGYMSERGKKREEKRRRHAEPKD